jgi:sensor histidine kinase YesM
MSRISGAIILYALLWWIGMEYASFPVIAIISEMTLGAFVIFISALIMRNIQRYYHAKHPLNFANISSLILFSSVGSVFVSIVEWALVKELTFVASKWDFTLFRFIAYLTILFIVLLLLWIDKQEIEDKRSKELLLKRQQENNEFELKNLENQWQPHFLFNSLNSINALISIKPDKAKEMVHLLSNFMRYSVRVDKGEISNLTDEIEHIQRYAEIEKVRFGDRLEFDIELIEGSEKATLPKLILQPLVENAIKYGLYNTLEKVKIEVRATIEDGHLLFSITNPFDEDSVEEKKGTGFGLRSIRKKLFILYRRDDLIQTRMENKIFNVEMRIPQ